MLLDHFLPPLQGLSCFLKASQGVALGYHLLPLQGEIVLLSAVFFYLLPSLAVEPHLRCMKNDNDCLKTLPARGEGKGWGWPLLSNF